jgi:hypothetical protein
MSDEVPIEFEPDINYLRGNISESSSRGSYSLHDVEKRIDIEIQLYNIKTQIQLINALNKNSRTQDRLSIIAITLAIISIVVSILP